MARMRFQDRPLREKLAHTAFLITSAAMGSLLLALLAYQLVTQRAALAEGMRAHAEVIGNNSAAAIMFGNHKEAAEVLAALAAIPDIARAELALPDGRRFALYERAEPAPDCAARGGGTPGWCMLRARHRIVLHGQFIGDATIDASLGSLYRGLALQAAFGALAAALALAVSLLLTRRIAHDIVRPLQSLVSLTHRVRAERDFSQRAPVEGDDEVGQLARSFNDMMDELHWHDACTSAELKQRRQNELQLNQIAYYDGVTGLRNRHYFEEKLEIAVAEVQRCGTSCGVLFIDLDDFKIVNDTLGHEAGDALLHEVAERLAATLRSNDIVCRIGGDEFAVILQHNVTVAQAEHVAANIVAALTREFVLNGRPVRIGASIGIALCPEHAAGTGTLVRNADTAMYRAKSSGKNSFRVYEWGMEGGLPQHFDLEQSLRAAIDSGQLELRYQPLVELAGPTRLMGFEAMVRWNSPDGSRIVPRDFVAAAEKSGLIDAIDDWAMDAAFRQAAAWQRHSPGLRIGVRLSARQLDAPDAVDRILAALRAASLPADLVDLQLAKGVLAARPAASISRLAQLRSAGVRVVLQDFRSAHSLADTFRRFPIDALRVDGGFVLPLGKGAPSEAAIGCALIAAADGRVLDLAGDATTAPTSADLLRHAGCRVAQGHLFANPLDAGAATALAAAAAASASHRTTAARKPPC